MIKINHTLQFLDISRNYIGNEGIRAIAKTLDNARISEFHVWGCNITVTGAKSLAAGLINNRTIKRLKMYTPYVGNDVTVDGAIAILKAAVDNGVCQEVIFESEYNSNDRVKELMRTLEERKRQEVESTVAIITK